MDSEIFEDGDVNVGEIPTSQIKSSSSEDLKIKYYPVDLPSNGKLNYPETVWYRDILVRDEKILSSSNSTNYPKILSSVLKSLLKDSDSFYRKLSIYDRDYLLLWIWANNYDKVKTFDVKCPVCHAKSKFEVDITKLDINEIDEDYYHPFEMKLSTEETIKIRLLTVGDEEIARDFVKKNPEYKDSEHHIMIVNSIQLSKVLPLKDKLKYVENKIRGKDMGLIRAFHTHFKYGVKDEVDFACPECEEVTPFSIPFSLEFLFPVMERDFKELLRHNKGTKDKSY